MNVIADIHIVPIGVGTSLSEYIAECETIIKDAGLEPHLHAYGTTVTGEWDTVFQVLRTCHEHLHEKGVPRLSTSVKIGTRTDGEESVEGRVRSVRRKQT